MFNIFKKKETAQVPEVSETRSVGEAQTEQRSVTSFAWANLWGTSSVRESDAMSISTVYSCIRLITNAVVNNDIEHVTLQEGSLQKIDGSSINRVLNKANPYFPFYHVFYNAVQDFVGKGNGYIWIIKGDSGLEELIYIPEHNVDVYVTVDPNLPYYYQVTYMGQSMKLFPEDLIHFRTMTLNEGIKGLSPISQHRLLIDTSKSATDFQKYFLDNSPNIAGVIETEKKLNAETVNTLRENFSSKFGGIRNSGKTPVLPDGLKWKDVKPISPMDADFVNQKKLLKSEICDIFGVPESMLGSTQTTYSNAEQMSLVFRKFTISPIMKMIEAEMTMKLIPSWKPKDKIKFRVDEFNLVSSREKAETLSLLYNSGLFTPNECREYYNKPAVKNGDELKTESTGPQNPGEYGTNPKDPNLIGKGNNGDPSDPKTDSNIQDNKVVKEI